MIWTIKVTLRSGCFATSECIRVIEIDSATGLDDLHYVIQQAVDFDDDHLYEFYIARTPHSRDQVHFDDENGELYSTTLADLFPLPKDRKLFYYFDYGDSWIFEVSRTRRSPFEALGGISYPRLIEKIGRNPDQYPGQGWLETEDQDGKEE